MTQHDAGELSERDFRDELKNHICGFGCGSQSQCICDLAEAMADEIDRLRAARPAPAQESAPEHWPENLHPRTSDLVRRFSVALAKKLRLAEEKYGYSDLWSKDDWEQECRARLYEHLEKGDPLDVAAYCAFMWHHGWTTYRPQAQESAIRKALKDILFPEPEIQSDRSTVDHSADENLDAAIIDIQMHGGHADRTTITTLTEVLEKLRDARQALTGG